MEKVEEEMLSMPMLLAVHAWAREVQDWDANKQAARELEDLELLGKGKVREEPAEPVVDTVRSEDMMFHAKDITHFLKERYGLTDDEAKATCARMAASGVFIAVAPGEYQFTTAFQRYIAAHPPKTRSDVKTQSRMKPSDCLERLVCIFRQAPEDPSEREVETRDFVREGLHFFYPPHINDTLQVLLASGLMTVPDIVKQLAPKSSHPTKATGSPMIRLGNASVVIEPLTTTDKVELTVSIVVGTPDSAADHQTRTLALSFKNAMRFIHGPMNYLVPRLPENILKQELVRTGTELQKIINYVVSPLPVVRYTQSQTSILAYRLGGRCTQSTLGIYARAHRLLSKIMQYPHVLGAAVFTDSKVVVHEMTEEVLFMVQHLAETSKARDSAWLTPSDHETPYHAGGLSNVLFDPVRYGYATKKTEAIGTRSTSTEIHCYMTVFLTHQQVEEMKAATVGAMHSQQSAELPETFLPSYLTEEYSEGRYYGLYIQHQDNVSTAVLLPVQALHTSCCVNTDFKELLSGMMGALAAAPEVPEQSDGCYAVYNKMDESLMTSRPNDPHFASECAFAHYFMNSFGDGEINRLIVSRGPTQHYFTSRSFAGIQTFYQSPVLSGPNRKMSVAEDKARDYLSAHPCLL